MGAFSRSFFFLTSRAFHKSYSFAIFLEMLFNTTKAYEYDAVWTLCCLSFIRHVQLSFLLRSLSVCMYLCMSPELNGAAWKAVCF